MHIYQQGTLSALQRRDELTECDHGSTAPRHKKNERISNAEVLLRETIYPELARTLRVHARPPPNTRGAARRMERVLRRARRWTRARPERTWGAAQVAHRGSAACDARPRAKTCIPTS